MKVFKFGGASVKNADAVINVGHILQNYKNDKICVVISAMGKTTNQLELLVADYFDGGNKVMSILDDVKSFHFGITKALIGNSREQSFHEVDNLFIELECMLETPPENKTFDFVYDQVVSFGEIISTRIVSEYLYSIGLNNRWVDARNFINTNEDYRSAKINWEVTEELVSKKLKPLIQKQIVITQGFIGSTDKNATTTLGREGSDYTASILAYGLNAESVTIWKDVDGVMNADPKRMEHAVKLEHISFDQAIELAYYGASVIHPKTIQPIKSKNIPLYVKSFVNPNLSGTEVSGNVINKNNTIPCYIFKEQQVLITLKTKNFSFIIEANLGNIFNLLDKHKVSMNLMQNSAISFSFCCTYDMRKIPQLLIDLEKDFEVNVIDQLQLITIYNFDKNLDLQSYQNQEILMEHRSANTLQMLIK